jgi:hypothetical protein
MIGCVIMRSVTKIQVKSLIEYLNHTKDEYLGFKIVKDGVELLHSNTSKGMEYRIDGYLERWKNNEDTFQECVERVQEYINDVIGYYNQGYKV